MDLWQRFSKFCAGNNATSSQNQVIIQNFFAKPNYDVNDVNYPVYDVNYPVNVKIVPKRCFQMIVWLGIDSFLPKRNASICKCSVELGCLAALANFSCQRRRAAQFRERRVFRPRALRFLVTNTKKAREASSNDSVVRVTHRRSGPKDWYGGRLDRPAHWRGVASAHRALACGVVVVRRGSVWSPHYLGNTE